MQYINNNSDFALDIALKAILPDGAELATAPPNCDFTLTFGTRYDEAKYEVGRYNGEPHGYTVNTDGSLHVIFDAHGLGLGRLGCMLTYGIPDSSYPDGVATVATSYELDVELIGWGADGQQSGTVTIATEAAAVGAAQQAQAAAEQSALDVKQALTTSNEAFATAQRADGASQAAVQTAEQAELTANAASEAASEAKQSAAASAQASAQAQQAAALSKDSAAASAAAAQSAADSVANIEQRVNEAAASAAASAASAEAAANAHKISSVIFDTAGGEPNTLTIEQGNSSYTADIPIATSDNAGIMTPSQVDALNRCANFEDIDALPEWDETAPGKTKMRVVNADGENCKTGIIRLLAINKYADQYYGVRINYASADPTLQRVGRDELHRTLPIQSRMRRCVMADNGLVKYYLHPTDSTLKADGTAANLDGTDGQVMVEIPEFYYKCEEDADGATVLISEYPLPGYHHQRLQYVSAYQATIDRENTSLASVCSMAERYRGGGNNAEWDGTYRTSLGRPVGAVPLTNFRAYARKRGKAGVDGCGWNCYTYEANRAIYWLFVIEYATLNSQAAFNAEVDSNGFKQGGLGSGVSNIDYNKWGGFNDNYPFVPCGITNELGNATGVVAYQMPTEYDPDAADPMVTEVPSYRGIENPFGHVFHWVDGALVDAQSEDAGGRSTLYVCLDPSKFSLYSIADYIMVGDVPRVSGGWIKRLHMGEHLCNVAAETGASSTMYYCDMFWGQSISSTVSRMYTLAVGCSAYNKEYAGLAATSATHTPTDALKFIGSRLCFVPA